MKKIVTNSLLALLSIIVLAACQSNSGIDPDEVIEQSLEKRDDVESYTMQSNMNIELDIEGEQQEHAATFKGTIDEKGNEANLETLEEQDGQEIEGGAIFVDDNVQYGLENGVWQK